MGDLELYLIRHCEATGQGADAPLTDRGRTQAEALAEHLSGLGLRRLIASPYRRAIDSVVPFAGRHGLAIETDERLVERVLAGTDLPDWRERLELTFADVDLCYPGGESSRQAAARGMAVVTEALGKGPFARATSAGAVGRGSLALVTHGCLLTLILRELDPGIGFADWGRLSNPDVYRVTLGRSDARVERTWPFPPC